MRPAPSPAPPKERNHFRTHQIKTHRAAHTLKVHNARKHTHNKYQKKKIKIFQKKKKTN